MPNSEDATRALARLSADAPDLRAAAIFDSSGAALAHSTGVQLSWEQASRGLWKQADEPAGAVSQLHVAGPDGEVFGVRVEDLTALAVTGRFALGSLVISDLRMVLRDLASGNPGMDRSAITDEPGASV